MFNNWFDDKIGAPFIYKMPLAIYASFRSDICLSFIFSGLQKLDEMRLDGEMWFL